MVASLYPKANRVGSDWVCGDIHGQFSLLERRLGQVGFDPGRDRLFCTGDLIDRGPESERALEFLEKRWFYSVRGNHEDLLLHHDDPRIRQLWRVNGGRWWDTAAPELREKLAAAFRQLPVAITLEVGKSRVGIVHGDIPAGLSWGRFLTLLEEDDPEAVYAALWGRARWERQDRSGVAGLHRLFCGHTVVGPKSVSLGNVTFVDTGAAWFGTLTLIPATPD